MDIHYTITPDDMFAFNLYCFKHTTEGKRTYFLMRFIPAIALAMLAVSYLTGPNTDMIPQAMWFLLCAVAYVLFYPRLNRYLLLRRFQKQLQRHESDEHLFRLDAQGISITSPKGNTAFYWPTIKEIVSTDQHIFFFYNSRCAAILTKRAFSTADQCTDFLKLARQYQQGKAH